MGLCSRGGQYTGAWGLWVVNASLPMGRGGGMGSKDGHWSVSLGSGLSVISLPEASDNCRAASFITRSN